MDNQETTSRRLAGRVCVIAGAVGSLGESVARRLASEGAIVVGIDRKPHTIGEFALQADLTDEAETQEAYGQAVAKFGRLDVIYNNAGLIDPGDHSALTNTQEVWERVLAGNLTTTWLSCKHGIPYLLQNQPSKWSVINTGSFLAGMGSASAQMAFNAAKAAVVQLSRDLGVHLARRGVRVNVLTRGRSKLRSWPRRSRASARSRQRSAFLTCPWGDLERARNSLQRSHSSQATIPALSLAGKSRSMVASPVRLPLPNS